MFSFLSHFSNGTTDSSALLLVLAIILCAFLLEDLAAVIVGVLAADGIISIPAAILFLYIGIFIGDAALYSLGMLARTHPRLAHYIDHDFTAPFRSWLGNRYALNIFSGHFIPGMRFTTYLASGFFRYPLRSYIPMAIAGGLILELTLFSLSYWFGSITSGWLSHIRWGIAGAFVLILFFIGRHNLLAYRAKKNELNQPPQDRL
jgi:membrane protein DedA with SNARE-associated domain